MHIHRPYFELYFLEILTSFKFQVIRKLLCQIFYLLRRFIIIFKHKWFSQICTRMLSRINMLKTNVFQISRS